MTKEHVRLVLIHSLVASKGWTHGYATAFVDDYAAIAQPEQGKLLQIIAAMYQIAGAYDAPEHVLDVLANPEGATQEQIDSLLPFNIAQPVPPATVQGEPVATSEATLMLQLAESIAASAHPNENTRLEVAYAIARHLKLDWPSAVQSDHEIRHWAEEYECAMKCFDDAGAPKADSSKNVYSLWGRIKAYATAQPAPKQGEVK